MKKTLTLLFAVGFVMAATAQSHQNDHGRNDRRNDYRKQAPSANYLRERDEQIARINFRYNAMIRDVQMDRHLRSNKKRKQIERLERERSQQINTLIARYNNRAYGNAYAYGRH